MEIVISFCITVYNQSDLLKKCLESIIPYKGDDIEIVVSDDQSTENIQGLIEKYHDNRIKYYKNEENLGHDRNILNALSKAKGSYAFLLRTRDLIIPDAIPILVQAARVGDASYITGEALNQHGDLKIQYSTDRIIKGNETLEANFKLFVHPSGSMYRLFDLDIQEIRSFLDENEVPKSGFIVHNMIRLLLATTGDFRLIKEPVWIYTDTEMAQDKAVNHSTGGIGVYDPSLTEKRYQYEVLWAKRVLNREDFIKGFFMMTAGTLDVVTWGFKLFNRDKQIQLHYDYRKIKFSVSGERKRFRNVCESFYNDEMGIEYSSFKTRLDTIFRRNQTRDALKYFVRSVTFHTPLYNKVSRIYKKYIKKL